MPIPANIFDSNGGAMPYGTSPVTANGVTYIVNSEDITPDYTEFRARNSDGSPGQARWTREPLMYVGEWQLATSATAYPAPGITFTRTVPNVTSPVPFVIVPGVPFHADNQPGSVRVAAITAKEVIYSITTTAGLA